MNRFNGIFRPELLYHGLWTGRPVVLKKRKGKESNRLIVLIIKINPPF